MFKLICLNPESKSTQCAHAQKKKQKNRRLQQTASSVHHEKKPVYILFG